MKGFISRFVRGGRTASKGRKIANAVGANVVDAKRVGAKSVASKLVASGAMASACALSLTFGCLQRPAVPQEPNTTNLFVNQIPVVAIPAIDLLFVVDNSISMADKQALLRQAVPLMMARLITPDCVDGNERHPSDGQNCASYGTTFFPEFQSVSDIHIGVITSSIGGFGSPFCKDPVNWPDELDKSRLIPKVRETVAATGEPVPDPTGLGFLTWTGADNAADAEAQKAALQNDLALHVAAAGEEGCGFEAPLEAWYRFLVDPEPPLDVVLQTDGSGTASTGVDTNILEQRAQFLRPDSLVAIVVLTDENDCSVMEGGVTYPFATSGYRLPSLNDPFKVASTQCDTNPNDRCCYSCQLDAPSGCSDTCTRPAANLPKEDDRSGVRCIEGKRRFGVDLLYPTDRYVAGLNQLTIVNSRTGEEVPNPLLAGRPADLVFFAGIVGVPWQDIATDASLADPTLLEYRASSDLHEFDDAAGGSRWELLLGRPGIPGSAPECQPNGDVVDADCGVAPVPPLDPFLVESIAPRSGTHPITGDALIAPGSSGWSPINGHEYDNSGLLSDKLPANDDLQYSCIFPLAAEAVKTNCTATDTACDCSDEPARGRPLCKPTPDAGATADTTQRYGKAYPPGRILRVLRDFGENSIVASICPKIMDPTSASFGYNPAVNAIVDRLGSKLNGQCLPRTLTLTDGEVPCTVIEATRDTDGCNMDDRRMDLSDSAEEDVVDRMVKSSICKTDPQSPSPLPLCSEFTICELLEAADEQKAACFGGTVAEQQEPGYCYIDPAKGPDAGGLPSEPGTCLESDESTWDGCINPHIARCDPTERRMLRFVGESTPLPGSVVFVACAGDAATEDTRLPPLPDPTGG